MRTLIRHLAGVFRRPPGQGGPPAAGEGAGDAGDVVTLWETDARGNNYYQSRSWYEYVGRGSGSSFGSNWLRFYHPDDRELLMSEWTKALAADGAYPYDIQVRIRRHDGAYRWFRVTGEPERDAAGKVVRWVGSCTSLTGPIEQPQDRAGEQVARQRILVVDDNRDGADTLAILLRSSGHEAVAAYDGPSALAAARRLRPEVIFLDVHLPGMSGLDVARALRAEPAFARTLIIAVSGFAGDGDVARARAAGCDQYLVKPYDLALVASLVGRRAQDG